MTQGEHCGPHYRVFGTFFYRGTGRWPRISIMVAPFYAAWPMWVRVLVIVPPLFAFTALVVGFWPKGIRQWRTFGLLLACFTVFCLVMFCEFHYA